MEVLATPSQRSSGQGYQQQSAHAVLNSGGMCRYSDHARVAWFAATGEKTHTFGIRNFSRRGSTGSVSTMSINSATSSSPLPPAARQQSTSRPAKLTPVLRGGMVQVLLVQLRLQPPLLHQILSVCMPALYPYPFLQSPPPPPSPFPTHLNTLLCWYPDTENYLLCVTLGSLQTVIIITLALQVFIILC